MKLEDIVAVKVGKNISIGNEEHGFVLETYTYENLIDDLDGLSLNPNSSNDSDDISEQDNHLSKSGEVVFIFVSSKAAIVSDRNKGKIIDQNFARLIIEHKQLDHSYLCYALNESHAMK